MTTTTSAPVAVEHTRKTPGRLGGAAGIAFVVLALAGNSLTGGGVDSDAAADAYTAAVARRIRLTEPREGYLGLAVLAAGTLLVAVKLASGSALYAADRRAGMTAAALRALAEELVAALRS